MSVANETIERQDSVLRRYRSALLALVVGLAVFGFAFRAEIVEAVSVWEGSTAYNHCFLILPIAAWLLWDRRHRLATLDPEPLPLAIPLAGLFALVWFVAQRVGVMEGRQLAAMAMLQALLLGVLGPAVYRALLAPFLYLFFLVPFGGFLIPALQHFTTQFVGAGLDLLAIPNYVHGFDIEIAQGTFRIATACAGLRFLIAAIAFSVLYALLIFRSTWKRLTFIGISLFVPVIANGFRALGIVWLGHALGSARAAATDHVLYGYLFFSIVLALLILLGLPFREDIGARPPWRPRPDGWLHRFSIAPVWLPAFGVGAIALLISFAGRSLDHAAAHNFVEPPLHVAGCDAGVLASPRWLAADGGRMARFSCDGGHVDLAIVAFPRQTDPRPVADARRRLGGNWPESTVGSLTIAPPQPPWTLVVSAHGRHVAASALKLDGRFSNGGLRARARLALRELSHRTSPSYVIAATTTGPASAAVPRLRDFLRRIYPTLRRLGSHQTSDAAQTVSERAPPDRS